LIYVVDTHAVVRYLEAARNLGRAARSILSDPDSRLILPTIVLAEAQYMSASGRTRVPWEDILQVVLTDDRFEIFNLTIEVLRGINTSLEMHDAIVCATAALVRERDREVVGVLTVDEDIRDYGLVETVW
jgi:predicted nucleic acid-binding protein